GAGKAEFSPLTVDIHSLAGLAPLLRDVASGGHIKFVELVGAETIKGESLKAYDLKLSDVFVSSFENDPGPKGVETALTFDYRQIKLTDQSTTHGVLGTPQTFAFDLSENKIATAASPRTVPSEAQTNKRPASLASLMASPSPGSSGSKDLVPPPPPNQDQLLPTWAATHS